MLDTDILIELKRDNAKAVEWMETLGVKPSVCIFAALELLLGCQSLRERRDVLEFLQDFEIVSPTEAGLKMALEPISAAKLSHGLGGFDVLMAATALEYNLTLYTFNIRHFRAVIGLHVVSPYVRS